MTTLYDHYDTDEELEIKGFAMEVGDATFVIARSGGANQEFQRDLEKKLRPHRAAMNAGAMSQEAQKRVMAEAYADHIILAWSGVTDREGKKLPYSKKNIVALMLDLPNLFDDIVTESQRLSNFIKAEVDVDAKS